VLEGVYQVAHQRIIYHLLVQAIITLEIIKLGELAKIANRI